MKVFYTPAHKTHVPPHEIFNGNREAHQEVPHRVENIKAALEQQLSLPMTAPKSYPLDLAKQLHSPEYVDFLKESAGFLDENYVYPSVFQYGERQVPPMQKVAQRGYFSFDLYTPINKSTFAAVWASAELSLNAAEAIVSGEKYAYALGRPPGHHAEYRQMGGYCYFANAALASELLTQNHTRKVATLDIDIHHGNGTQHLFYNRKDILTISLHAKPEILFPFFSGWADETGKEDGVGFNKNYPLEKGITDDEYQKVLDAACAEIKKFAPEYLVVSIGYDTFEKDPIGVFKLTTGYYKTMGQTIKQLNLPTVLVQEGGYNTKELGDNAVSFVSGFL